jgi:hypothetical protein
LSQNYKIETRKPKEEKENQVLPQVQITLTNNHDFKLTGAVANYNYAKPSETNVSSKRSSEVMSASSSKVLNILLYDVSILKILIIESKNQRLSQSKHHIFS